MNVAFPGPLTFDHVPVPDPGTASSKKSLSHSSPPFPAFAEPCSAKTTVTEDLLVQGPFTSVHLKTYVPKALTVTFASGSWLLGLKVAVPGPLSLVHVPVPMLGTAWR